MLQTADGALSQVTTLLNRAVTLATEGATSGVTTAQATALQTEYSSIAAEIDQIGQNTNFNGQNVFSLAAQTVATNTGTGTGANAAATAAMALTAGLTDVISTNSGANIYTFTAKAGDTVQTMMDAINANVTGVTASIDSSTFKVELTSSDKTLTATAGTDTVVKFTAGSTTTGNVVNNSNVAFISDGTSTSNTTIATTMSAVSSTGLGVTGNLLTTGGASAALTALVGATGAINQIAQERGTIGASVNRLTAASNVMASQVTNLQSASNSIQNADIGKTVANMTQYNVLQSTGMAALQQSNQAQQAVLKLVQ
jgi:flagellin